MRVLLFLLFPILVWSQDKPQKIESVFKDFTIEIDNNLFSYQQDLNILYTDISEEDLQLNKEFYYQKSTYNPFNYKFEQKPLHNNFMFYNHYEYQMMGGSQGLFYTNLIGGLIESVFGELSFKL